METINSTAIESATIKLAAIRLAAMDDLPQLKSVYKDIISTMNQHKIQIWDDIYPCEFFQADIERQQLYILEEKHEIAGAFVLCRSNTGANAVKCDNNHPNALYIDRFGVNVRYLRKGVGSRMLHQAAVLAKEKGAEYLRLFVVDINKPAIQLYRKNGFVQAEGVYEEKIDHDLTFTEYGFEKKIVR